MDDEVMGEDHEHRDDAQQLDAGISPPPFEFLECAGTACLTCAPLPLVLWMLSFMILSSALVLLREIVRGRNDWINMHIYFDFY